MNVRFMAISDVTESFHPAIVFLLNGGVKTYSQSSEIEMVAKRIGPI